METNLMGAARLTQLCLPHMRARRQGWIFNISSTGGKLALPLGGWYHASTSALEGFSDALRLEVAPFGIRVVVAEPGGVASEWAAIAIGQARRHSGRGAYAGLVQRFSEMQDSRKPAPATVVSD